ncbi:MAG: AraC family transcriptional regulator [Bacteroidales bacterium]
MNKEQEKIVHIDLSGTAGVTITHGYNIANAFPVHFHSTYNLGIIELGEREFTYRGARHVLRPNDIFVIQPFEPHSCKSHNNASHCYKIISFNFDKYYYFPRLVINHRELLVKLQRFHALAEFEGKLLLQQGLLEEILELLKTFADKTDSLELNEDISAKIHESKRYIEDNCTQEVTLKEMADIACLSEYHFNRSFHRYFGLSPYAYYLVCKMKKSQRILSTNESIADTAFDIGLFDQSHFTRLFKKHIGVTPGKYLKSNKRG